MSLSWRRFVWRSWKNVFEAWELFRSSLRSLRTFECHCVLLCRTLLRRRVTELSNLCGFAQVRAVKKSCHAALVFSRNRKAELLCGLARFAPFRARASSAAAFLARVCLHSAVLKIVICSFRAASCFYLLGGSGFFRLPVRASWFAHFVPASYSHLLVALFCRLPVHTLRGLAGFVPLRGCICLVGPFLPLTCLCFAVWLVSRRFVLVPASWLSWRLRVCSRRSARFMPLGACTCFVAGSWRLPACTLALGSFRAVSCLYLRLGWFLALAYLRFGAWLVSSRFVLVPASWLVLGACLPVVGGLARFRAVSCLYLLGGSLFAAFLPVLCALAGSVPFRACTWFVARFSRLPACSWWLARFRAVSCICLVVLFLPLTCLCFAVWLVSRRFVLVLYLLRGWFLALAWVQAATDMHPACPIKKQNHLQNSLLRRTQFWVRKTFSKPASLKRACLV